MNRREMIQGAITVGAVATSAQLGGWLLASEAAAPKFTLDLCPGRIGVRADQNQVIDYAAEFGFQSVEPYGAYLAGLTDAERSRVQKKLAERRLVWGAAGLPVQFRADEATFRTELRSLPRVATGLQRAGVTRVGTWLSPSHDELTYLANFKQHVRRLREIAKVLADSELRFGLEYVGPKKSWSARRHAFIHTMAETKELLAEINADNMGFVLDSWHWHNAGEAADDILSLTNDDVVAVDLNDAPSGIPREALIDNQRELPMASGVIDLAAFLGALVEIGYDGPIRAEPFNGELNAMDDRPALKATSNAMKRAFALVEA